MNTLLSTQGQIRFKIWIRRYLIWTMVHLNIANSSTCGFLLFSCCLYLSSYHTFLNSMIFVTSAPSCPLHFHFTRESYSFLGLCSSSGFPPTLPPVLKLCSLGILLNFFILNFFTYRDNSSTNLIGLLWSQTWQKGSFEYNSKEQWEQTFIFSVLAEEANIWKMGPQTIHMHNKIHKTLPGQKNYQNAKMQLYTMNS